MIRVIVIWGPGPVLLVDAPRDTNLTGKRFCAHICIQQLHCHAICCSAPDHDEFGTLVGLQILKMVLEILSECLLM